MAPLVTNTPLLEFMIESRFCPASGVPQVRCSSGGYPEAPAFCRFAAMCSRLHWMMWFDRWEEALPLHPHECQGMPGRLRPSSMSSSPSPSTLSSYSDGQCRCELPITDGLTHVSQLKLTWNSPPQTRLVCGPCREEGREGRRLRPGHRAPLGFPAPG